MLSRATKGKYRLGWRLFALSQTLLDTTKFKIEARRVMEEVVDVGERPSILRCWTRYRRCTSRSFSQPAFELLTTRMPDLRLAPEDQTLEFEPNISFRGPKELWVMWMPDKTAQQTSP